MDESVMDIQQAERPLTKCLLINDQNRMPRVYETTRSI